jgi:hypothetical protein
MCRLRAVSLWLMLMAAGFLPSQTTFAMDMMQHGPARHLVAPAQPLGAHVFAQDHPLSHHGSSASCDGGPCGMCHFTLPAALVTGFTGAHVSPADQRPARPAKPYLPPDPDPPRA